MAATHSLGKAGLLILAIFATLSLQVAEAQNVTYVDYPANAPRWAVACIVMLAIMLGLWLLSCCLVPICTGLCRKGGDGCQSGFSIGK